MSFITLVCINRLYWIPTEFLKLNVWRVANNNIKSIFHAKHPLGVKEIGGICWFIRIPANKFVNFCLLVVTGCFFLFRHNLFFKIFYNFINVISFFFVNINIKRLLGSCFAKKILVCWYNFREAFLIFLFFLFLFFNFI